MPLVLVDLLFMTGTKGGMEQYVRSLYAAIAEKPGNLEFVALASSELAAGDTSWFPGTVIDSGISGENRMAWARGELFSVQRHAKRLGADLVHCPANLGPARRGVPLVLTLHDLLPFRHPEYVPGAYAHVLRLMLRLAARSAQRLVTSSVAARDDIVELLGIPAERIDIVPLAGYDNVAAPVTPENGRRLPRQILSVGNRMPHKNFPRLIESLLHIPEAERPLLVITGSHGDDPLAQVVAQFGLEKWVSLRGWLSAEELDELFDSSTLVVFPTLFEGFGLPPLEAMSRGCPALCSDIPVMHEVAGTAARYVDPYDPAAIGAEIARLLNSPAELDEMSRAGVARAAQFSWSRTADGVLKAFHTVLAR
ncbi:glycosyltransferase family 4 protein [Microterricola viridarii]|uniref:Uncharacterized protein n=1 Tax=Microterricola viridarii TaxID=412690 RepID=A0A0Y0N9W1_9MICO|nr:glycosyltransferase family 1 protein [Microterricola viridarii]AMB57846.1 hypothetical protein AWU67_02055 [Microterricola viridarii]